LQALPWGRVATSNLLFTRPGARPQWILMAHRDSKSQLVPTLVRVGAVFLGVAGWIALVVLAALWISGPPMTFPAGVWVAAVAVMAAGVVLGLSWAGNASPGALDNATGLAALLAVASREPDSGEVAFLLTDAEELGLVGAREVVGQLPAVQGVINVDGLADEGTLFITEGAGPRRTGSAPQLVAALLTAGSALEVPVQRKRLPRALQVDHLPLVEAGLPAVTLLRGDWSTLMRVHRPADDVSGLRATGAADGATLLSAAVRLLRESSTHLAGGRRPGP
ncbi:MAG TPA: M28 family peptidase, partial [Longimicrobiales bacterium]|nr:M28 family peptidase [Longimicrobiales bacterium]